MKIRRVCDEDISLLAEMIEDSCRDSWKDFYPPNSINFAVLGFNEESLKKKIKVSHFYVVEDEEKIIGCGAIKKSQRNKDVCSLVCIFVDPKQQGKGIGRKIMQTLEKDEIFLGSKIARISSSVIAVPFYRKFGYEHKGGYLYYKDGQFVLEKNIRGC